MIIQGLCNSCFQAFTINVSPSDAHLLKQIIGEDLMAPCPRLCGGRINMSRSDEITALASDPRLKPPLPLTVTELFKAVNGIGLPDEIPTSPEVVEALLQLHKVTETVITKDGNKIYLHEIHLANGTVVHLGAGLHGAMVVKLTKKEK